MICVPFSTKRIFDDRQCPVEAAVITFKPDNGFAAPVFAINFVKTIGLYAKGVTVVTAFQHIDPVFVNLHRHQETFAFFENIVALFASANAGGTGDVSVIAVVFEQSEEKAEVLVVTRQAYFIGFDILGAKGNSRLPAQAHGNSQFLHHVAGMYNRCRQADE